MLKGTVFLFCIALHSFLVVCARAQPVRIQIECQQPTFVVGAPQWATISVFNQSRIDLGVDIYSLAKGGLVFVVSNDTEKACEILGYGSLLGMSTRKRLQPGKSVSAEVLLSEHIRFSKSGRYSLQCHIEFPVLTQKDIIMINTNITLDVAIEHDDRKLSDVMRSIQADIRSANTSTRSRAVRALASVPSSHTLKLLQDAIGDIDESVALPALYAIRRFERAQVAGWVSENDALKAQQIVESTMADCQMPVSLRIEAACSLGAEKRDVGRSFILNVVTNSLCTNDVESALFRFRGIADVKSLSMLRNWTNGPIWKRDMIEKTLLAVRPQTE